MDTRTGDPQPQTADVVYEPGMLAEIRAAIRQSLADEAREGTRASAIAAE